jgi:hypothetical protein
MSLVPVSTRVAALFAAVAAAGCAASEPPDPLAHAPEVRPPTGWAMERLFVVPGQEQEIEVLAAAPDAILLQDTSIYLGVTPGLGTARRTGAGWRAAFPGLPDCFPVRCASGGADGIVVSCESGKSFASRETAFEPADDKQCRAPALPASLDRCPSRRGLGAEKPAPPIAAFEIDEGGQPTLHFITLADSVDAKAGGSLRYSRCVPSSQQEEIVELAPHATTAAMAMKDGAPLVAFTSVGPEGYAVTVAHPGTSPAPASPSDARILDALDACSAIHIEYQVPENHDKTPAERACSIALRDAPVRKETIALSDARCGKGDARACYVSGSLRTVFLKHLRFESSVEGGTHDTHQSTDYLDADDRAPSSTPEATAFFEKACKLGERDACTRALVDIKGRDVLASPFSKPECDHGNAYACDLLKAWSPAKP